jgi:pimeloyl-ACP methyl ester carboxylesterase
MVITLRGDCKIFFDVYGCKLNIQPTSVSEKPTLIILHGGPGLVDHTLYVEFWSQFSDVAQVIFLDQRGCGRSDRRTATEWNLQYWAADLYQFCQILGIEKPILAGISMGGYVLCEYLAQHSESASGVIFCNTEAKFILEDVCKKFSELAGAEVAEIAREQLTNPTSKTAQVYQQKCVKYFAKNAYSVQEISRCKQNIEALSHFYKDEMQTFNYLEDLKKIKCPALLMVGESSPLHLPIRAEEMAEKITPELVTLHLFKDAGAPVYKDSPKEAEKAVRLFLEKIISN